MKMYAKKQLEVAEPAHLSMRGLFILSISKDLRGNPSSIAPRLLRVLAMTVGLVFVLFGFSVKTASASTISKPINNLGLVSYWSFEDATGTQATDFSGKGNPGTLTNGPTWVAGKIGKAVSFDGSDDSIRATPVNPAFNDLGTGDFTIAFWFKTAGFVDHGSGFNSFFGTPNNSSNPGWGVVYRNTNKIILLMNTVEVTASTATATNTWRHATIVRVGSAVTMYTDGSADGGGTGTAASISNSGILWMGSDSQGSNLRAINASLDDVRIYNRALSATEIASLYANTASIRVQSGAALQGLVGYWPMNEGFGSSTVDATGQGTVGVLTGSPIWTSGKFSSGLQFDTTTDKRVTMTVSTSTKPQLNLESNYTLSLWFKPSVLGVAQSALKGGQNTTSNGKHKYLIHFNAANQLHFITGDGTTNDVLAVASGMSLGSWQMYTCSLDRNNLKSCYINGALVATSTNAVDTTLAPFTYLAFGGQDSTANDLQGTLDDVRIYNRALSAKEVSNLYNATVGGRVTMNESPTNLVTSGLVGYWSFDGKYLSTTTATDQSGSGNNGTLSGSPKPSMGKHGQALSFDGVDDFVSIDTIPAYSDAFSVSGWIKVNGSPGGTGDPYHNMIHLEGSAGTSQEIIQSLGIRHSNDQILMITDYGIIQFINAPSGFDKSRWNFLAATVNAASQEATIYLNGVSIGQDTSFSTSSVQMTGTNRIGARLTSQELTNGQIDEVRVYNRVLSADEIYKLYRAGK